jgi:hypothetical protein
MLQRREDRSTTEKKMMKKCVPYALNHQSGIIENKYCKKEEKRKGSVLAVPNPIITLCAPPGIPRIRN